MKIGINGYEAVIPRFGYDNNGLPNRVGSSEVCFQLLNALEKLDKKNDYTIYLPVNPTSDMPEIREKWKYEIIPNSKMWTLFGLNRKLLHAKHDIFFSPTHYAPLYIKFPSIISILDVSYEHFPEMFTKKDKIKLATWGKLSLSQAAKVITISNSSKDDIIKIYNVQPQKVTVVHLGVKEVSGIKYQVSSMDKFEIKKPFLLFVGTLQPRKNIARLIEALSLLSDKDINLVVVGRKGWHYEDILSAPERFQVADRVKFLEDVSDEELPAFYKEAEMFVLPSLYEGFGLPVLEAMKYDCPAAISNVSSLPEAGGEAAIYFDPENAGDIAKKIDKILSDKNLRDDMIKKGREQVKKFSWEKAANEVLEVFNEVSELKS